MAEESPFISLRSARDRHLDDRTQKGTHREGAKQRRQCRIPAHALALMRAQSVSSVYARHGEEVEWMRAFAAVFLGREGEAVRCGCDLLIFVSEEELAARRATEEGIGGLLGTAHAVYTSLERGIAGSLPRSTDWQA